MADRNVQIRQRNGEVWDNLFPKTKADLVETSTTKQFVSATEKNNWNAKQDELGFTPEDISKKGIANGYAPLDANGHVASQYLPSYVDDVVDAHVVGTTAFEQGWLSRTSGGSAFTPEVDKIYSIVTDGQYQNTTYRWSGTSYVRLNEGVVLGETSSTAHRGDHGKAAYTHSQSNHAPTNAQKNSDITKAEIEAKLTGVVSSHSHAAETPTAHANSHITGGGDVIPNSIAGGASGLMSGADKTKLNGIASGATRVTTGASEPASPTPTDIWLQIV